MRTLNLLVAGLFAPQSAFDAAVPQLPSLLTLLARAQRARASDSVGDELLQQLFGICPGRNVDAPVAALSWLGETGLSSSDGYWLRADPVHLHADQARLLLFGPRVLAVQMDEAKALAAAFNAEYGSEGWRLETPHPLRWYLRLPDDPGIRTHALNAVIGRNIDTCLPLGVNGKHWRGVLNEVQMLFHDSPVNAAREQRGELAINSVWFWGGGCVPVIKPPAWTQLCSAQPWARGLALVAGVEVVAPAQIVAAWDKHGAAAEQLVVLTELDDAVAYGDAEDWHATLLNLERDWFGPALSAMRDGRLDRLRLYPGDNNAYEVTRADLRRFWRRRREFDSYRCTMEPDDIA